MKKISKNLISDSDFESIIRVLCISDTEPDYLKIDDLEQILNECITAISAKKGNDP